MAKIDRMPLPPIPSRKNQGLHEHLRVHVYIAGSTALMTLCKTLGATAYYVSATGRRNPMDRIANRRDLRHGSILADPANPEATRTELPHGDEHFLSPILADQASGLILPSSIRILNGMIEVALDPSDNSTAFEKRLARALSRRQLNNWLGSDYGQRHMIDAGLDPKLRLFTDYRYIGAQNRLSQVQEAFLFRPKREMQGLIDTIDAVRRINQGPASRPGKPCNLTSLHARKSVR